MIKARGTRDYQMDCEKYIPTYNKVILLESELEKVNNFCKELEKAKIEEHHYKIDNDKMLMRFRTGFTGEVVVSKYLGIDATNLSIGKSKDYDTDDLGAVNLPCGIKTAEMPKYHVVHRHPVRPEIIVLREDDYTFYICGLATIGMLKEFQDDSLVLNAKLRARGSKTGFYGYQYLKKFNNIEELKELL